MAVKVWDAGVCVAVRRDASLIGRVVGDVVTIHDPPRTLLFVFVIESDSDTTVNVSLVYTADGQLPRDLREPRMRLEGRRREVVSTSQAIATVGNHGCEIVVDGAHLASLSIRAVLPTKPAHRGH